jgi:RNA polymerase sigma factor (sigma-70 family)
MTAADIQRNIVAVWRIEQPRLITSLSRMLRDVPLAEDLTQEALLAALEHWPATGIPQKPGAWLLATAKRRALDHLRRTKMLARKHEMITLDIEQEQQAMPDLDAALDDDIGDELLRLIFTACHPLLSREARAALALRMICGLTTEEIARAFLLPDATIAQRIVRAKRTLSESGLAYETPRGEELSERLASVLEVVYIIFNEGNWQNLCARRSSNSTARWPSAWPKTRKPRFRSWTAWCTSPRSKTITCWKASAATCSTSSAAIRKRAPRSKRRPCWRATSANRTC